MFRLDLARGCWSMLGCHSNSSERELRSESQVKPQFLDLPGALQSLANTESIHVALLSYPGSRVECDLVVLRPIVCRPWRQSA